MGNNGYYSSYFKLTRSIRQGCPISALLFLLVAEIIAINIRNDDNIKGIKINDTEYKINLMADDTTLALRNIKSLSKAILNFERFELCSGLKLNLNKTVIIPIGSTKNIKINLPIHLAQISVKHGPFKALGVWFTDKEEESIKLNYNDRLKKMQTLLSMWRVTNLSLKGKITILRTLILPQIQFLFGLLYIPEYILKTIDDMMFQFL